MNEHKTLDEFLEFIKNAAPEWYEKMRIAYEIERPKQQRENMVEYNNKADNYIWRLYKKSIRDTAQDDRVPVADRVDTDYVRQTQQDDGWD